MVFALFPGFSTSSRNYAGSAVSKCIDNEKDSFINHGQYNEAIFIITLTLILPFDCESIIECARCGFEAHAMVG